MKKFYNIAVSMEVHILCSIRMPGRGQCLQMIGKLCSPLFCAYYYRKVNGLVLIVFPQTFQLEVNVHNFSLNLIFL